MTSLGRISIQVSISPTLYELLFCTLFGNCMGHSNVMWHFGLFLTPSLPLSCNVFVILFRNPYNPLSSPCHVTLSISLNERKTFGPQNSPLYKYMTKKLKKMSFNTLAYPLPPPCDIMWHFSASHLMCYELTVWGCIFFGWKKLAKSCLYNVGAIDYRGTSSRELLIEIISSLRHERPETFEQIVLSAAQRELVKVKQILEQISVAK